MYHRCVANLPHRHCCKRLSDAYAQILGHIHCVANLLYGESYVANPLATGTTVQPTQSATWILAIPSFCLHAYNDDLQTRLQALLTDIHVFQGVNRPAASSFTHLLTAEGGSTVLYSCSNASKPKLMPRCQKCFACERLFF